MSVNNNNGEKEEKWYSMKPETKQKIKQIGVVFSGVLLYLIYNLQPALIHMITNADIDETWRIYLLGAIPVILMGIGSTIVIIFSLGNQGQQQPSTPIQQIGTPAGQIHLQTPTPETPPT